MTSPARPTIAEIRRAAAEIHGMTEADIQSRSRVRQYVDARQDAWIVSRRHRYSTPQIAGAWGVDHSAVVHCLNDRRPHARSEEMTALIEVLAGMLAGRRMAMVDRLRAEPGMPQADIAAMIEETAAAQEAAVKIMRMAR